MCRKVACKFFVQWCFREVTNIWRSDRHVRVKQFYSGATYHITTYLWDGFDYLGEKTL